MMVMHQTEIERISERWQQIEHELAEVYEGKVQAGDPVTCEAALLAEQDEIELVLGENWLRQRSA